jgi:hypothetical protein
MTTTSGSKETRENGTTDSNGEYTKFLLNVASILQDLSDSIHAELKKTKQGEIENIELMCLDTYTGFMLLALNFGIGRSMSKSTVTSAIKSSMGATSTNKKSVQLKSATASTSRPTGSHSSNSRNGQMKKSQKK